MIHRNLRRIDLLIGDKWQGGIWERLVSCVKRCLKKVVGIRKVSYIELQTLIMEVEAVLNNRPLCHDYDSEIEDVLTPNNLIYGRRLESINEKKDCSIEIDGYEELAKKREKISNFDNTLLGYMAYRIFNVTSREPEVIARKK